MKASTVKQRIADLHATLTVWNAGGTGPDGCPRATRPTGPTAGNLGATRRLRPVADRDRTGVNGYSMGCHPVWHFGLPGRTHPDRTSPSSEPSFRIPRIRAWRSLGRRCVATDPCTLDGASRARRWMGMLRQNKVQDLMADCRQSSFVFFWKALGHRTCHGFLHTSRDHKLVSWSQGKSVNPLPLRRSDCKDCRLVICSQGKLVN